MSRFQGPSLVPSIQTTKSGLYEWNCNDFLGRGATARVYHGYRKDTGEPVAVKQFTSSYTDRGSEAQIREFTVPKKLDHPNIVKVIDEDEERGSNSKVLIMEYCSGGNLHSIINEPENSFGLVEEEYKKILFHLTAGIKELHDNNVVHRDVKPGNIMKCCEHDGNIVYKLTDFGAARELQLDEQFNSMYGTEEYLHPDVYEKAVLKVYANKMFDATVDLWSMGVTLYHIATGSLPFRPAAGRRDPELMHRIITTKEPGVISAIQMQPRDRIIWSRTLPTTTRLSKDFQQMLTEILAHLMEIGPTRWSFSQYLNAVESIRRKIVIHVFLVPSGNAQPVYMDRTNHLEEFKEKLQVIGAVAPQSQILVFSNSEFNVDPTKCIIDWPLTDPKHPIFMFSNDDQLTPELRTVIDLSDTSHLSVPMVQDHTGESGILFFKNCIARMARHWLFIKQVHHCSEMMEKAVSSYMAILEMKYRELKKDITTIIRLQQCLKSWLNCYISSHNRSVHILRQFTMDTRSSKHSEDGIYDLAELIRKEDEDMLNLHQSLESIMNIPNQDEKFLLKKPWNSSSRCHSPSECENKVEQILLDSKQTQRKYTECREKSRPRFEVKSEIYSKRKLLSQCNSIDNSFRSICEQNLLTTHKEASLYLRNHVCELNSMAKSVSNVTKMIDTRVASLNQSESKYVAVMNELMSGLAMKQSEPPVAPSSGSVLPPAEPVPGDLQLQAAHNFGLEFRLQETMSEIRKLRAGMEGNTIILQSLAS